MRLQVYLSRCGKGSRRGCERLIAEGRVRINGQIVMGQGYEVLEGDRIEVDGKGIEPLRPRYYVLNKPKGWISVDRDPRGRRYVVDLIPGAREQGCFPVGRLDMDTTGLLIITNDGQTANRIAHPRHGVGKTYTATIQGDVSRERIGALESGARLEDGYIVDDVRIEDVRSIDGMTVVRLTIHEGRRHIVKRLFSSIGTKVVELERNSIGSLHLKGLMPGEWGATTLEEIERKCLHHGLVSHDR